MFLWMAVREQPVLCAYDNNIWTFSLPVNCTQLLMHFSIFHILIVDWSQQCSDQFGCWAVLSRYSRWQISSNILIMSAHVSFVSYILIQFYFGQIPFRSPCSIRAVSCLWAISLSFLWWFVNYSFKHGWPEDWITGLIDHWARKMEFQWPLKPKCDLNDSRAEQPQQANMLNHCRLKMHHSEFGSQHPSFLLLSLCKKHKTKKHGNNFLKTVTYTLLKMYRLGLQLQMILINVFTDYVLV